MNIILKYMEFKNGFLGLLEKHDAKSNLFINIDTEEQDHTAYDIIYDNTELENNSSFMNDLADLIYKVFLLSNIHNVFVFCEDVNFFYESNNGIVITDIEIVDDEEQHNDGGFINYEAKFTDSYFTPSGMSEFDATIELEKIA